MYFYTKFFSRKNILISPSLIEWHRVSMKVNNSYVTWGTGTGTGTGLWIIFSIGIGTWYGFSMITGSGTGTGFSSTTCLVTYTGWVFRIPGVKAMSPWPWVGSAPAKCNLSIDKKMLVNTTINYRRTIVIIVWLLGSVKETRITERERIIRIIFNIKINSLKSTYYINFRVLYNVWMSFSNQKIIIFN